MTRHGSVSIVRLQAEEPTFDSREAEILPSTSRAEQQAMTEIKFLPLSGIELRSTAYRTSYSVGRGGYFSGGKVVGNVQLHFYLNLMSKVSMRGGIHPLINITHRS
jgi:hypothetical protein